MTEFFLQCEKNKQKDLTRDLSRQTHKNKCFFYKTGVTIKKHKLLKAVLQILLNTSNLRQLSGDYIKKALITFQDKKLLPGHVKVKIHFLLNGWISSCHIIMPRIFRLRFFEAVIFKLSVKELRSLVDLTFHK